MFILTTLIVLLLIICVSDFKILNINISLDEYPISDLFAIINFKDRIKVLRQDRTIFYTCNTDYIKFWKCRPIINPCTKRIILRWVYLYKKINIAQNICLPDNGIRICRISGYIYDLFNNEEIGKLNFNGYLSSVYYTSVSEEHFAILVDGSRCIFTKYGVLIEHYNFGNTWWGNGLNFLFQITQPQFTISNKLMPSEGEVKVYKQGIFNNLNMPRELKLIIGDYIHFVKPLSIL